MASIHGTFNSLIMNNIQVPIKISTLPVIPKPNPIVIPYFDHPKNGRIKVGDIIKRSGGIFKIDKIEDISNDVNHTYFCKKKDHVKLTITRLLTSSYKQSKKSYWTPNCNLCYSSFKKVDQNLIDELNKKHKEQIQQLMKLI